MSSFEKFNELPLQTVNESGRAPEERLTDAKAANELFGVLKHADRNSAINRARQQAMFDGANPYDDAKLRRSGQAFRTNLNFGEAEAMLENAMSAYVDLLSSVENLVEVKTLFGEENERAEYSGIISQEISNTIRAWPNLDFSFLNLCHNFVAFGVGVGYFMDDRDWRWNSTGLGDIRIPRHTLADDGQVEVATASRQMPVHMLYNMVRNREAAEDAGWNVDATLKAIREAFGVGPGEADNWERIQESLKNNDFSEGAATTAVELAHFWVQEFSGKVSHYITAPGCVTSEGEEEEFLFRAPNRYDHINSAMVFFTYGIGTNGTFHGIRGLGYKIFPHIQVSNRIRCQMVDNGMLSSSMMLQPQNMNAMEAFSFNYMGPFALLSPGMEFIERPLPNLNNSVVPVLNEMSQQLQNRVGQYTTANVFNDGRERTRFEVAANLEQASKLSVTAMNLFYAPWERLLREQVRRIVRDDWVDTDPGYREIAELQERIVARGVPLEALFAVDWKRTRAVRGVGGGSQARRTVSLQQLNELAGAFDEVGRQNLFRDQAASIVGYDKVDRYIRPPKETRVPVDQKLAVFENIHLEEGNEIQVNPDELHVTHLDTHIPRLEQLHELEQQGEIEITEAAERMGQLYIHAVEHLKQVQQDPTISGRVAAYNKRLQNVSETVVNGQKALEARQAEKAEQGEDGGPDLEMLAKLQKHQLDLRMMEEKHQLKMMLNLQEAQQKRALRDADKAVDLKSLLR